MLQPRLLFVLVALAMPLVSAKTLDPRETTYTYNELDQITTVDGARTDVVDISTFSYDLATSNLLNVVNAAGHTTTYSNYTSGGLPQTITTPNGAAINVQYDWKGKVLQQDIVSNTGTQTTYYSYDNVGQLIRVQAPNGSKIFYEYDKAHRLVAMQNDLGERIEYTLDSAGNITTQNVLDSAATIVRQHQQVFDDLSRMRQHVNTSAAPIARQPNWNMMLVAATLPLLTRKATQPLKTNTTP